jgi:hypothetical protein
VRAYVEALTGEIPVANTAFRASRRYRVPMTAAAAEMPEPQPTLADRTFANASPAKIRAALIPEDQATFDRRWCEVTAEAAETFELDGVYDMLESWRRVAWTTNEMGHDGYRRMLARAAHRLRGGEQPPGTVPWSQVKAELGL